MSPLAPAIIVFERRPCWESELKRRLMEAGLLVRPCRGAADALALAKSMPASVLIIDLGVGPQVALQLLNSLAAERLMVSPVIIAPLAAQEFEWPARDLGAAAFLPETVPGDQLAELCRRLLEVPAIGADMAPCRTVKWTD